MKQCRIPVTSELAFLLESFLRLLPYSGWEAPKKIYVDSTMRRAWNFNIISLVTPKMIVDHNDKPTAAKKNNNNNNANNKLMKST